MNAFHKKSLPPKLSLHEDSSRSLYNSLLDDFSRRAGCTDTISTTAITEFLREKIRAARAITVDFPDSITLLETWCHDNFIATGQAYRQYLAERRAGGGRRYFTTKSHAIDFLDKSAPTKLVDGSWLYGLLRRWSDPSFSDLIRTYLEELGDGNPDQNHVLLYRRLLAEHDCHNQDHLDDGYFLQGAIQLALAHRADEFIPEIIGFNLGYEQLPLHLLVTAYELAELGIDPYYFTLHITIDNLDSGHARRAIASAAAMAAAAANPAEFFERMKDGYRLNAIGAGALDIVDSFDLEREVLALFTRKAAVGQYLHCDRCRIEGRTINEWLAQPDGIPALLRAFESTGWIRRNEDPANSRFWSLIEGEKPLMFGVFDRREQQIIRDWISGTWTPPRRPLNFRRNRELALVAYAWPQPGACAKSAPAISSAAMQQMIDDMSPALHDSAQGLNSTHIFSQHAYSGRMHYPMSPGPRT